MIPVKATKKPKNFDEKVRNPGLRAIAEMVGKTPAYPRTGGKAFKKIAKRQCDIPADKFPAYWTEVLDELFTAYNEICAYSCFRIHPVTGARSVDHFAPKSTNWREIYKWTNYRLCCSRLNSRKNNFTALIDPFEISFNYFKLELVGFQVLPGDAVKTTSPLFSQIKYTIDTLGLNDFKNDRAEDAEGYWDKDYSLKALKRESPFVAYELWRQNRLNNGDVW